ncbi:LysE/ArgO family amino acid transporter [Auraticoccus cholistanensis]|uniref:LysE/ArgO family amino acid transporter n=1 Tax=Auraticoccus cholistanensis TaxID=2656650 RepID=UPI002F916712
MDLLSVVLTGFLSGAALIVAIGAQNAFVLRQGLRREHVLPVVLLCTGADVVLMSAGAAGLGVLVEAAPWFATAARVAGGLFLLGYALLALRRAVRPGVLVARSEGAGSRRTALLTAAALTFLNPHVYLDTVVLLGALANGHGDRRWWFVLGSATASAVWFSALGAGAHRLSRWLDRPRAWRVIDVVIGVTMLVLGVTLLLG